MCISGPDSGNAYSRFSSGRSVAFSLVASTDPVTPAPSISNPTSFDESTSGSENIAFDKSVELFNATLTCSANEESTLKIDVEADVDLTVTLTFEIKGTVIPPDVSEFVATTSKLLLHYNVATLKFHLQPLMEPSTGR